jgi:hypothetical protein
VGNARRVRHQHRHERALRLEMEVNPIVSGNTLNVNVAGNGLR